MTRTPAFFAALVITLLAAGALAGCIERTISIDSTPPGALVYLNDQEIGRTPVTVPFTFYGKYDVRIEKEGYQSITTLQKAQAPWWEAPGPDIFAEALPGEHSVDLKWNFTLEPTAPTNSAVLIEHAKQLRALTNRELGLPAATPAAGEPDAKPIVAPAASPQKPQAKP